MQGYTEHWTREFRCCFGAVNKFIDAEGLMRFPFDDGAAAPHKEVQVCSF
jgi:hypothetical protein